MNKSDFKKTHQKYVDDLNHLAKSTKTEVIKGVIDGIDLHALLSDPKGYESELKTLFLSGFIEHWKEAVKIGQQFGHSVIKESHA